MNDRNGPDGDGGEHERNAEAERIDREQAHAGAEARLVGGKRQNGRQDRADAGRPAESEREAHDVGAGVARPVDCVEW